MAERLQYELLSRRSSFRKSVADAGLPPEYLDALEQKRKQLDESIHKYIASKEREFKTFEKDLRQQFPAQPEPVNGKTKRRTSSESMGADPMESPQLRGQKMSAVDALMANGLRRDGDHSQALDSDDGEHSISSTGVKARSANLERNKDLVGVFTQAYIPALEGLEPRRDSAPPAIERSAIDLAQDLPEPVPRNESDTALQAKAKRPAHLQFASRTSSSGSSADGRLASAMKSPSLNAQPPKRKRVSLAVGDSIVAPSDNVPIETQSQNNVPSHSRTRTPAPDRERDALPLVSHTDGLSSDTSLAQRAQQIMTGVQEERVVADSVTSEAKQLTPRSIAPVVVPVTSSPRKSGIDPDGDLFDLEHDSDDFDAEPSEDTMEDTSHSGDEQEEIVGTVAIPERRLEESPTRPAAQALEQQNGELESDLTPEQAVRQPRSDVDHVVHVEFHVGSAGASQQPTRPGFRRPSVLADPVFAGDDYQSAEAQAVQDDIYGSSFARPTSKGSFTGGSLGQSFMEQHAQEMMRLRSGRNEQTVKT